MSTSSTTFETLGLSQFGRIVITSASLAAANGLLTIDLMTEPAGPWVEIEAGATLNGIRVMSGADDLTAHASDRVTGLFIVASPAVPYTLTVSHESQSVAAAYRLWVPSNAVPGMFGDGVITQHHVSIAWDPGLQRWRVPWSAA